MAHIVGIEDPQALDPQVVGRKFAALARAARSGFAVPEAMAIATKAHAHFLATGSWPAGLRDEATSAARRLSAPLGVSIRSSATREDLAGQSFAGQYRSFLEVDGEPEVLRRVEECWQSGSSDTVRSYLQALNVQGCDTEPPLLAVIIQRMVNPAVAGVAFSRNPLHPERDEMVIEAVKGHAEGLVSGRRSPCRAYVQRDGRLSIEGEAPAFRRISRKTPWMKIAGLLRRLEESYGEKALDIEWAVDHGRALWLLQVRPITTLAPADALPPKGTWTRKIADDLWADRLEPFMADVMLRHAPRFDLSRISRLVGIAAVQPALAVINGYLYVNCDGIRHVIAHIPPALRLRDLAGLLPADTCLSGIPPPPAWTLVRLCLGIIRLPLKEPGVIPWVCLRSARPATQRLRARLRPADGGGAPTAGGRLEQLKADLESLALIQANNQWPYFHATLFTWLLRWLAVERLGMDGAAFLGMLSRGADNVTIGIERWFRETALRVAADPNLKARFLSEPAARLALSLPADLQTELDAFLQRHGCRSRHRTLLIGRWAEAPDEVVGILQSLVRHPHGVQPDPQAAQAPRAERPAGIFRLILKQLAGLTRRFLDLREDLRFLLDEALFRIRQDLLHIGRACGLGEAVFFLKLPEIEALVAGGLTAQEAASLSAQRRRRFQTPFDPGVFWVDGQPEYDFSAGGTVLRGIGTSPGRVTGRAVIVEEPAAAGIRRGDVVVARHTDPGWTPIFSMIGGIVMEEGGLLNHCSIVARELGVPSIVGVRRATRLIPAGARVTIDGGAGIVRIETD
ncbi:MAG: PEP-utilizing enzyme [Desulfobacterales bacterium]|jgi:pyruvate,water dikinase|nr:PEP-utilizing enzyme [Desulfobacterales bacterium]